MAEPEPLEQITVRVAWVGMEEVPILFVNQAGDVREFASGRDAVSWLLSDDD